CTTRWAVPTLLLPLRQRVSALVGGGAAGADAEVALRRGAEERVLADHAALLRGRQLRGALVRPVLAVPQVAGEPERLRGGGRAAGGSSHHPCGRRCSPRARRSPRTGSGG